MSLLFWLAVGIYAETRSENDISYIYAYPERRHLPRRRIARLYSNNWIILPHFFDWYIIFPPIYCWLDMAFVYYCCLPRSSPIWKLFTTLLWHLPHAFPNIYAMCLRTHSVFFSHSCFLCRLWFGGLVNTWSEQCGNLSLLFFDTEHGFKV